EPDRSGATARADWRAPSVARRRLPEVEVCPLIVAARGAPSRRALLRLISVAAERAYPFHRRADIGNLEPHLRARRLRAGQPARGGGVGHVRVLVVGVRRKLPAEQTTVEFPATRHIGNGNGEVTKVSSHCFSLRRHTQNRRTHSASYHMNCCEKQKVTRARV